ncbi:hypothetical protein SLA2020_275200 [Shorea laevis]
MAGVVPPGTSTQSEVPKPTKDERVDYMNLRCPIPYEEIHRESFMSLKPELFEGMRFDFTKLLNPKFALSHSVYMGPTTIPSQSSETIKIPTAQYEFGANFIDPKLMLVGRLTDEPHMSHGIVNLITRSDGDAHKVAQIGFYPIKQWEPECMEAVGFAVQRSIHRSPDASSCLPWHFSCLAVKHHGKDYRTQFQLGNGALFGANYIQSVTPHLSLGGEVFGLTDKMVAAGQVASTGMVALSYVQKVCEKVSLASDLIYNYMSRDVTASVGYDYILRQCRLRGKMDSNGCTSAFLEERLNMGLKFILSAEIDHSRKDYKFGFGINVGE